MNWKEICQRESKSRNVHGCTWCGQGIPKDEIRIVHVGKLDCDFQANHYHRECFRAAQEAWSEGDCLEFMSGDFERGSREER